VTPFGSGDDGAGVIKRPAGQANPTSFAAMGINFGHSSFNNNVRCDVNRKATIVIERKCDKTAMTLRVKQCCYPFPILLNSAPLVSLAADLIQASDVAVSQTSGRAVNCVELRRTMMDTVKSAISRCSSATLFLFP